MIPQVAIIIPVYNKAAFVAETLNSVLRQTHSALELIVVDDGSTDTSLEVIRETLKDQAATVVTLSNGGVSRARNAGAQSVSPDSKYLLFLDADDVLDDEAVARLVDHLERHPEAAACYCRIRYVDALREPLLETPADTRWVRTRFGRREIPDSEHDTPLEALWAWFSAIPSACLVRRTSFSSTNGWDSQLCPPVESFTAEDKDMLIKLALVGKIHRLPCQLLDYRVMPSTHKDALYRGLKLLNAKWWSAELSPAVRRQVRTAVWFDARVALFDAICAVPMAIRHDGPKAGATAAVNAGRATARWATTAWRNNRGSRSWVGRLTRG